MMGSWAWLVPGGLAILAGYQQFHMYQVRRDSKKRDELFQIVTENAADMIALVDVKGHRLYNSPAYKRILGYTQAELGETSAFEQIHPDDRFKVLEAAREARSSGVGKKLEYRIRHKDGTWRVLESLASTIRNEQGEVAKLVIVNRDVTERKRAEEQLEHNSFHDGLTGLPNRVLFLDRLQRLFAQAQRNPDSRYAVLFVDVDGFKAFNESLGTTAGDRIIVEIAGRLSACLRHDDTIARPADAVAVTGAVLSRFGGDEFTVVLDTVSDPSDAMRVGQRIKASVAQPILMQRTEVRLSASVGIAISTAAHKHAEDLLQEADVAMRRAKAMGGSRCEMFDESMHTLAVNRLKLEAELRTAVERHQFRAYYQPVVHLESKRVTGFAALLRWQHPEQGLISPHKFLEAAEDTGLLVSIGHWLLVEACRQLCEWEVRNPPAGITMAVNLSARQFADPQLVSDIQASIRESGIQPAQLQLELTENVAAADPKASVTVLSRLKHLAVGVVLDNFGTGQASLNGLRRFPVDALKIDRSLVNEMMADRKAADIVELIILLAHKMNLKVIADGIETAKQFDRLHALGCEYGQGDFFSKPVAADDAEQLLHQR